MQENPKPQKSGLYHQASQLERIVAIVTIIGTIVGTLTQIVSLGLKITDYMDLSEEQSIEVVQKSIPKATQTHHSPD